MRTGTRQALIAFSFVVTAYPLAALATPSSNTLWSPSTSNCQPWGVPHITYDTYFGKGPSPGSQGAPAYPIDTGLTVGFLPYDKIQGEAGFDALLPTENPWLLNAKLCTPDSSFLKDFPGVSFGVYDMGFKSNVTNYDVLYLMFQKTIPGSTAAVALGGYRGLNQKIFTNSDGNVVQSGLIASVISPEIVFGRPGLKKIYFNADVQTGKNVLGAWSAGAYVYFSDNVDLATGPVFFFDKNLQPGKRDFLWTLQLDIDILP